MKKLIFTVAITAIIIFIACDKVKHPNQHPEVYLDCKLNSPIVKTNALTSGSRKILIEDYTGHTCGNCPPAAVILEDLVHNYEGDVIAIANHVSLEFATPKNDFSYREDFRDAVSTEWDAFFECSDNGLPKGVVNRMATPDYFQNPSAWSGLVAQALSKPFYAQLDVTTYYDTTQHYLNVKVKTTFKKGLTDSVKLSIVLTQDNIIAEQKDYGFNPDKRKDYKFDHILINSMNGTWGDLIKIAPSQGDTITTTKSCYVLNKCFYKDVVCVNDKDVSVIAFIYRSGTKEILQVEKVKIR